MIPEENGPPGEETVSAALKSSGEVIEEVQRTLRLMDEQMNRIARDIDDPEWLMMYVNYLAARDLFVVEAIHRHLTYAVEWDNREKREFLEFYLHPAFGPDQGQNPGFLQAMRRDMFREIQYLTSFSSLLEEFPWMMRSQFTAGSEFSYWYIMYTVRSLDPLWVDNTILPPMLTLISWDEITPVSYLWLKNPASLSGMDQEILFNGYPWTTLFHIIRINREIYEIILEIYPAEDRKPGENSEGILL